MSETALIAIDQGTTSTRTMAFSPEGRVLTSAQCEFPQIYPQDGWVEHDPEAIWETVLSTLRTVIDRLRADNIRPVGIGITNQRETTLVWDRRTGKPIYNAIVWQDRRTADICRAIEADFPASALNAKTGLLHDPYFSATKTAWILDHVDGARDRAAAGELAFGTVDSFLIWRLTGGAAHKTDATNASRTNLYNIRTGAWDPELCELFNVPMSVLPEVCDCAHDYGLTAPDILPDPLPVAGVAGDQQAAAVGQGCFDVGDIKSTYGTGCFILLNTGEDCRTSKNKLLSTVAYQIDGQVTYALEGSIFIAGAAVQWLRDGLGLIDSAQATEAMAKSAAEREPLYMVPAFTGLGAPWWDPEARGAIFGITRDTGPEDFAGAALDSVCYQTHDLLQAMADDGVRPAELKTDGGMVANNWFLQRLSDITDLSVERPTVMETTALGAAILAGLQVGVYSSLDAARHHRRQDRRVTPQMNANRRDVLLKGWKTAVRKVLTVSHMGGDHE